MPEAKTMLVYENGVPRSVQVHVAPDQVAVDYIDEDGNVISTVVHDARAVEKIAKRKGLKLERKDLGGPPQRDTHAEAVARTHADSTGAEPIPEGEDVVAEPELEDHTYDELAAIAKKLKIKGRSKLNKDELIAAIRSQEADEEK